MRAWLAGFGPGHLRRLCQEGDRPPAITLLMALGLLLRPGAGLTPAEVLLYGLHRRRGAAAYIGEAAWAARCRRLNRASSRLLSDKLTLSYLLAGSRVAAPRTLAYLGVPQALLPVPRLGNGRELGEFLRQQGAQPLFLKPLRGSQGQGCVATDGLEPGDPGTGPRLRLGNGNRLPLAEAGTQLLRQLGRRAIVQERIRPDPLLRPVCGDTCATVRLLSTCDGQGVRLLAAILKLPAAGRWCRWIQPREGWRPGGGLTAAAPSRWLHRWIWRRFPTGRPMGRWWPRCIRWMAERCCWAGMWRCQTGGRCWWR